MSKLITNQNPVDIFSVFEKVNAPADDEVNSWQLILFSENMLRLTKNIWSAHFEKIIMQSFQVLVMRESRKKALAKNRNVYLEIIATLTNTNEVFSGMSATKLRDAVKKHLSAVIEEDSPHYINFANLLTSACSDTPDVDFVRTVSDFLVANTLCFSVYNSYFCAGKISLSAYKEADLANIVLTETDYGSHILNSVVTKNAKALFELAAQTVSTTKSLKSRDGQEKSLCLNKNDDKLPDAPNDTLENTNSASPPFLLDEFANCGPIPNVCLARSHSDVDVEEVFEEDDDADEMCDEEEQVEYSDDQSDEEAAEEELYTDEEYEEEDEEECEEEEEEYEYEDEEEDEDEDVAEVVNNLDNLECDLDDDFEVEDIRTQSRKPVAKHSFVPRPKH